MCYTEFIPKNHGRRFYVRKNLLRRGNPDDGIRALRGLSDRRKRQDQRDREGRSAASLAGSAEKIDLKGRTLLPAFLDPHSHLSACANRFLQLSLSGCKTVGEILKAIETFIAENAVPAGEWVLASDYDHAFVKRNRLTAVLLRQGICEKSALSCSIPRGIWEFSTPPP